MFKPLLLLTVMLSGTALAVTDTEAEKLLTMPLENSAPSAVETTAGSGNKALASDCLLTPSVDASLASPVVGVIDKVLVQRGDLVKKGQVLVKLRSEVEQATLKLNRAQAEYGKRTIQRNIGLYERNLISEQEKDEIIINNRLYGFEVAQTEAMLGQKTIRSPIDGVVVETFLDPGEYVGDAPILQVAQLDPLYIEAVVPARYFGAIPTDSTAEVTLEEPLESKHSAKVVIVDRVLDAASGTFGVRLSLPNPGYRLPAGLKCSIRFDL
ncbi:efflux RND transporter periplasmic adaptor subunit [Amphritea pacifica]|uniref:Efflux RND transporter periplasmic adaptor subunit n=1 Tax=Amphritea pacifica TaxID=2811233 RepID=A0ABS2W4C0_9GAMM|nr:efflux RND transporter periplasmic adaptor subunit [Amphritea pacifica]MBN0986543.1 efflux RND transporter periplasmic adaptor subunit [Amphritea pacifica]